MAEVSKRAKTAIYLMLIGSFLGSINQTILSPALPSIMADLDIDAATGQWLTTIFMLVNGIMIPCTAYLMARFKTRTLYLTAMILFAVGTLLCGLSHSFALLMVARVLQAMGFGVLMPLLSGTVLMVYPPNQRGKAMGMIGLVFSIAPAIGPSLAGFFIDAYGWNVVFLGLVPLVVIDIILSAVIMPNTGETHHMALDKISVVLSTIGFGGLLYGFSSVGSFGWTSPHVYVPLVVGAIVLYFFIKRQRKLETPLLRFDCFKSQRFTIGLIIGMIINAALLFGGVLTPIYLQDLHGYSVLWSALIMLPASLIAAALNPLVGSLFDKIGARPLAVIGLICLTIGSGCYIFFRVQTATWILVVLYTVRIIGINLVMMPINTWSMTDFQGESIPHANAVYATLRQIAGSVGTAIFVSIYSVAAYTSDSLTGIHMAFGASAVMMIFAVLLAFFKIEKKPKKSWER